MRGTIKAIYYAAAATAAAFLADSLPLFAPVTPLKRWDEYSEEKEEWQFGDIVILESSKTCHIYYIYYTFFIVFEKLLSFPFSTGAVC